MKKIIGAFGLIFAIASSGIAAPVGNDVRQSASRSAPQKVLVAYFSATGTGPTKTIARRIQAATQGDLFAIVPQDPYTAEDLNYNDNQSRSTREVHDAKARPAISNRLTNMDQYDVVYLGYPIWWGTAPKIIYTFLESYSMGGKTIIPFCTSGSSGIGASAQNLHSLAPNATWVEGRRFATGTSQDVIASWVAQLSRKTNDM